MKNIRLLGGVRRPKELMRRIFLPGKEVKVSEIIGQI